MYLASAKDSLDEFVANDGFNLLIGNIRREVDFALENPEFGGTKRCYCLLFDHFETSKLYPQFDETSSRSYTIRSG